MTMTAETNSPQIERGGPALVAGILVCKAPSKWTENPPYQNPAVVAGLRRALEAVRLEDQVRALGLAAELVELVHQVPVKAKITDTGRAHYPTKKSWRQDLALALALLAEIQASNDLTEEAHTNFHQAFELAEDLDPEIQATVLMRAGASCLRHRGTQDPFGELQKDKGPDGTLEKALALFSHGGTPPSEVYLLLGASCPLINERIYWLKKALRDDSFDGDQLDPGLEERIQGETRRRLVQELWFYPGVRLPSYLCGYSNLDDSGAAENALLVGLFHLRSDRAEEAVEVLRALDPELVGERYRPWLALALGEALIRLDRSEEAEEHLQTARRLTELNSFLGQLRSEWVDGNSANVLHASYTEALGWAARIQERSRGQLYPLGVDFVPWQDCISLHRHFYMEGPRAGILPLVVSAGGYSESSEAYRELEIDLAAALECHRESLGFDSIMIDPTGKPKSSSILPNSYCRLSLLLDDSDQDVMSCSVELNFLREDIAGDFYLAQVGFYLPRLRTRGYVLAMAVIDLVLVPTARIREVFDPKPGFPTTWQDGAVEACSAAEIRKRWPQVGPWFSRRTASLFPENEHP